MNKKEIEKFDRNNNEIYCKWTNGYEEWKKYDEYNKMIYYKGSKKNVSSIKSWMKYNKNNDRTYITEQEFNEIEFRGKEKEFLSRKEIPRFELMEM